MALEASHRTVLAVEARITGGGLDELVVALRRRAEQLEAGR